MSFTEIPQNFEATRTTQVVDVFLHGESAQINAGDRLPDDDPAYAALHDAGINGEAVATMRFGGQNFAIVDISSSRIHDSDTHAPFTDRTAVGDSSPLIFQSSGEENPLMLVHFDESGKVVARMIRPESPILIGREAAEKDHKSNRFNMKHDGYLSRQHAAIVRDRDGKIHIVDQNSTNGSKLHYAIGRNELVDASQYQTIDISTNGLDYGSSTTKESNTPTTDVEAISTMIEFARTIDPDELVRDRGNDGKELNEVYVENHKRVREYLINQIALDTMYEGTVSDFADKLKYMHILASGNNVYDQVGSGSMELHEGNRGVVRSGAELVNHRFNAAQRASEVATHYKDPYSNRFETGNEGEYPFSLPGIPEEGFSKDFLKEGNYEYHYPSSEFITDYFAAAQAIGKDIQEVIKSPESIADPREALGLIAKQYQYLVIARPFDQINNSIFMNLVNSQVKMLGLKGIPHGEIDTIAQRLKPEYFSRYFADEVMHQQ